MIGTDLQGSVSALRARVWILTVCVAGLMLLNMLVLSSSTARAQQDATDRVVARSFVLVSSDGDELVEIGADEGEFAFIELRASRGLHGERRCRLEIGKHAGPGIHLFDDAGVERASLQLGHRSVKVQDASGVRNVVRGVRPLLLLQSDSGAALASLTERPLSSGQLSLWDDQGQLSVRHPSDD